LFLAETRRLWELEKDAEELTVLQASSIINAVYMANGMDQVGLVYLVHSVSLAKKLGIFDPHNGGCRMYQTASDFTAWALFRYQA
jgi:hypothetical protein